MEVVSLGGQSELQPAGTSNTFKLDPESGDIPPMSSVVVAISVVPKSLGRQKFAVVVDIPGVGGDLHRLPICVNCTCPTVSVSPTELDLRRCFLRHPYEINFNLVNHSAQHARFRLVDAAKQGEEVDKENGLVYASVQPE
ncbi:unnamed protein product, partial [Dicrocoelium dendriticum]